MASQEYEEYLQSEAWSNRRNHRLAISGRACAVCRSKKNLHVHHLTYVRIFNEDNADLLPLCQSHHSEAERLIKAGRLSRTGNVLHLAAETIRLLCNPDSCRIKAKKEKKIHRQTNGVKVRNENQEHLMQEVWFQQAILLTDRNKFKKLVKATFHGPTRNKMLSNAFMLYDRATALRRESIANRAAAVNAILNYDADGARTPTPERSGSR